MKLRLTGVASLLVLMALLSFVPLVHANTSDFTIDNFSADYTLGQDDPQGTLAVREQLIVEFTDYNHGIFRAIPSRYNSMPQHVHVSSVLRDGASEQYTTSTSNSNLVLKIGNPNQTITGLHHYEIDYKVTNVIRFVGGHDELNWNVNGTGWEQPFLHVSAQLHVPANLAHKLTDGKCFTGATGSTSSDCLVAMDGGVATFTTTRQLSPGETLTFNEHVPSGFFKKPTLADKWVDYRAMLIPAAGIPLAALLVAGGAWFWFGRDAKGRGTIVPEYSPPDGLKPAEIEVLLKNKLGNNGISATIIDLAIRKYLRIQESGTDGVLGIGKHKTYSFEQLTTPAAGALDGYEAQVFSGIFDSSTVAELKGFLSNFNRQTKTNGLLAKIVSNKAESMLPTQTTAGTELVSISSLKNTFYTTAQQVQKSIPKSLATRGYFRRNPASASNLWHGFGTLLVFGTFFLFQTSIAAAIGTFLAGLIMFVFGWLMPSRTAKGATAKDAAEGLKLYLNTAEKDRIAMLQSPNAPYAAKSEEPVKTVELFEKLLPYAMVLGVEREWAQQFESIYTTPPDWYSGNWSTFNAVYLANSLNDSMGAMNSTFAAPSSGSSGFSGGAGGGGGGGGGGGW